MARQSSKKNDQGTLLLVGEHGDIKRIRHKKGMVKFLLFAMLISIAISGGLYVLYQRTISEKAQIDNELQQVKKQVLSLRHEKEKLMTRLVLMQAGPQVEPEENPGEAAGEAVENTDDRPLSEENGPEGEENDDSLSTMTAAPNKTAGVEATKPSTRVDAKEFAILRDKEKNTIQVKVKVVNAAPASGSIAGYTLVALKPENANGGRRLVFPGGAWTTQQSFEALKGYLFSISKFKIIRFKPKKMSKQQTFESAEVLIYAENGSLMLQKEFSIEPEEKP